MHKRGMIVSTAAAVFLVIAVVSAALLVPQAAQAQDGDDPESTPSTWDAYEPNNDSSEASTISTGQTIRGLTLHSGDRDWFLVWLKQGWAYRVNAVQAAEGDPMLRIYNDGLSKIHESRDVSQGDSSASVEFTASRTGWYYVEVRSQVAGLFGEYRLELLEVEATATPTPTPTPTQTPLPSTPDDWDEYEPNDSASQAEPISVGYTVGLLTLHDGDQDWFKMRLTGGREYEIEAFITGGGDPKLELLAANGSTLIAQADDGGPGQPSPSIKYKPAESGYFYVAITSQVAGLFCEYELSVIELAPTPTPSPTPGPANRDAYEPNDGPSEAAPVGVGNTIQSLTLHRADEDWFKARLVGGRAYEFKVLTFSGDPKLSVYASDGTTLLGESSDGGRGDPSPVVQLGADSDQYVYLAVSSEIAGLFCEYSLDIREMEPKPTPEATPTPNGWDHLEPNDEAADAVAIGIGQTVTGLTLHNSADEDWFWVRLTSGRIYEIEAFITSGDPKLTMYDSNVTQITSASDGGAGNPSPTVQFVPDADMYVYLQVASEVQGLTCDYELTVLEWGATITPTPAPTTTPQPTPTPSLEGEPNDTFDLATELAMGFTVNGVIEPNDNDFFKFYVEAGVRYQCEAMPSGNLDTNMIVYDDNRNGIGGNNNTSPDNPTSVFDWISAYEGWSYVLVGPVAGTGEYTLHCKAIVATATPTPMPYTGPVSPPTVPDEEDDTPNTVPTATKAPWETTPSAPATPTPEPGVTEGPSPTPGPSSTPAPPVRVIVYYDKNNNGYPEPDEGIVGATVLLLDVSTNKPVAFAQTDESGFAEIDIPPTSSTFQEFRVSLPFLGFSKRAAAGQRIEVEVKAQRLPGLIP